MSSAIALDKVELVCTESVKPKSTRNDLVFIAYSNIIYIAGISLYNIGYLLTQWQTFVKEQDVSWFKNW